MTTESTPKYACRLCGSADIRGGLDSYPVFQAEGDMLVYRRSEPSGWGIEYLYCLQCGKQLELTEEEFDSINFV